MATYLAPAPDGTPGPDGAFALAGGVADAPRPRPGNAQWLGARQEQQDAFGFAGFDARGQARDTAVLAVVADGLGGLSGGRTASQRAVAAFLAAWDDRPARQPVPEALLVALAAANRAVHDLAVATAGEGEVGTTLVAAAIADQQLYWVAAGDSRLYWYRAADGALTPCNEAHNLALHWWRQAPDTGMSADEIAHAPGQDHLISFLGLAAIPEIDRNVRPLPLQPGDWLLLCSDGVDGTLSREELAAGLAGDPQRAAAGLIARIQAQNRPHQDNATVALLACPVPTAEVTAAAAAPVARPASPWAPTALHVCAGLLLAGVLGIVGWYARPDPVAHGLADHSSPPGAARISLPLALPPRAEPAVAPSPPAADEPAPVSGAPLDRDPAADCCAVPAALPSPPAPHPEAATLAPPDGLDEPPPRYPHAPGAP